jgi:hypothetical protein
MSSVLLGFALGRPMSADDPHRLLVPFGVDDENEAGSQRTDSDEAVLLVRMDLVEDLQIVLSTGEEGTRFLEGDTVLPLVHNVLGLIPDDPHGKTISHWLSRSMADSDGFFGEAHAGYAKR